MSKERIYNFSAGPSMLAESVLETAASEMLNYKQTGMSVMEMSHRSKQYDEIFKETKSLMRKVMNIPDDYEILFLQGGASTQFAMIPMNLLVKNKLADYVVTGYFSKKAAGEAKKYGEVNAITVADFSKIPSQDELSLSPNADYVHICENNTIYGTKWYYTPDTGNIPLVSDMSSCILSEPIDVTKYGLIYAGAQKNMAPAGLTIVIVKKSILSTPLPFTPTMLDYNVQVENDSMYNTPSTYMIFMAKLVLEWIESIGGLEGMAKINKDKAAILYDYLDASALFNNTVDKTSRSIMNVTFKTTSEELDAKFIKEASALGFVNLKGHRAVGGMRASIYNAMPTEGLVKLVEFMKKFESESK